MIHRTFVNWRTGMRKNKVDLTIIAMPIGATNTITHIYPTDKLQNLPPSR